MLTRNSSSQQLLYGTCALPRAAPDQVQRLIMMLHMMDQNTSLSSPKLLNTHLWK